MEDMTFDTFEQLFSVTESAKPVRQKPGLGPHRFKVLDSKYNEKYEKWELVLANKEGQEINKNLPLNEPSKAVPNQLWIDCLFDSRPQGRYIDFNWPSCVGRYVDAEVGSFTPEDKEGLVIFVWKPVRVDAPIEKAVAKRTTDQKAKVAMSATARDDIPF